MGYTKLFSEIIMSTIWREDDKTRIVWITMLAIRDRWHIVNASLPGLADAARVSIDDCRKAIQILSSPDSDSRSKEFEGRRIKEVDGGWFILNGEKYRNKMSLDERREYNRIKQASYRKNKMSPSCVQFSTESTQTETETETETENNIKRSDAIASPPVTDLSKEPPQPPKGGVRGGSKNVYSKEFEEFWNKYPKRVGKGAAFNAFNVAKTPTATILNALTWQTTSDAWMKEGGQFIPHPATYLRQRRWEDEPNITATQISKEPEENCAVCYKNTGRVFNHAANAMIFAQCKHGEKKKVAMV